MKGDYTTTTNKSNTLESKEEMRAQIKLFHDNKLRDTFNAHADHAPLTDQQVKGIQINLKQLKGPNRSYYEFSDPTCGNFYLGYHKSTNPFYDHDFTKPIANRLVRKMAESKAEYLKRLGKR